MDDYIRRKSVTVGLDYIINELNKLITDDSSNDGYTDIKSQVKEIKRGVLKLPPADVQPVVHCRECIWLITGDDRLCEDCVCDNAESPVFATDEDFGCIYGKRKGDENDQI